MRFIFSFLMLFALFWAGALAWFVGTMPRAPLPTEVKAEAIVVLTGGSGRVEHGLQMLAEGAAPVLFISGVGAQVKEEELMSEHATAAVREKIYEQNGEIVLDHVARSTVSNADQTTAFLRKRGFHRVRLITADYHMRRSIYEFRTAMPELEIIPDPVFPKQFQREQWWAEANTRHLVFSEFYKYLAVLMRDHVRPDSKETMLEY